MPTKKSDELIERVPDIDANEPVVGQDSDAASVEPTDEVAVSPAEESAEAKAVKKGRKRKTAEVEVEPEGAQSAKQTRNETMREVRAKNIAREARRSANEAFLVGWSALDTAKRRKTILYGTVAGIEEVSVSGTGREEEGSAIMLAVLLDGMYKVMIPFGEIYRDNPIDMKDVTLSTPEGRRAYVRRQKQMAGKLLNVSIPLIITDMFSGAAAISSDYSIAGSRREAIRILEKANYLPNKTTGRTIIEEGSVVDGYVTSVARYGLSMNVGGVDVSVPVHLLTFRYVRDLHEYYQVGQKVPVVVTKIATGSNGDIRVAVTSKPIELERAKMRHGILPVGTNTVGIITSVHASKHNEGEVVMNAYLPSYDMPATVKAVPPAKYGKYPESGDEVGLIVTGFSEAGFVRTTCHRFLGFAGFLNR